MRIHVTKLNGEKIFGALNIGKLIKTNVTTIDKKQVFLTERSEFVFCDNEMLKRIEERLKINQK